jgi:hypothetical protein
VMDLNCRELAKHVVNNKMMVVHLL